MPNVLNEFAGDGVTRTFTFSMTGGYLSRDYVYFYTRPNEDLLSYTPYDDANVTWVGDFTVELSAPVPIGTTFVILRSTPLSPLVDFQNTSRITEKNLNTTTWQGIHIAAESADTVGRIQLVAQDAKQESAQALVDVQAAAASADTAAAAAIAASSEAATSRAAAIQAGADAADAALSAATAVGVADAAALTANAANATASTAAVDAAAALTSAGNANATANSAASQAGTAVSTANAALSTANAASTAAAAAVTTSDSASATANSALTIANEAKGLVDEAVSGAVMSFNGRTGVVTPQVGDYTKSMVGLSNVDNTPDLEKPISTATSNAIGLKADTAYVNIQLAANATADRNRGNHTGTQDIATVEGLQTALSSKLPSSGGVLYGNLTVPSLNGGQLAGMRNKIINGNFGVNQRGVSGTVTLSAGAYGHDRWKAGASGCTYTYATTQNVTTITITSGSLVQVIEGLNLQSGTHVLSWHGTAQGRVDGGAYGASGGVTGTAVGGTNQTIEFNAGTLCLVQYEPGTVATPFEFRAYGMELALCQRYFYKTYPQGVNPGAVSQLGAMFMAVTGVGRYCSLQCHFPVTMRATPSIVIYSPNAGTAGMVTRDGANVPAIPVLPGTAGVSLRIDNNLSTQDQFVTGHLTASTEL